VIAVIISVVGSVVLDQLFQPRDFAAALHAAATTRRNSPAAPEIMGKLRRAGEITVYVADPIAGLIVGIFVGLVQKKHPVPVALIGMVPHGLLELVSDDIKSWSRSVFGVARYAADSSLPFFAAFVGVVLARYLITRRFRVSEMMEG